MIESILSAISVLLVFVVLFVDITTKKVLDFIDLTKPNDCKVAEYKKYKRLRVSTLCFSIASTCVVWITAYLFLPKAISIITTTSFSWWDFDVLNTAFILIESLILVLGLYMLWLLIRIAKK